MSELLEQLAKEIQTRRMMRDQATKCPSGGDHDWAYRSQTYRCMNCGLKLSKDELKRSTDSDTIQISF